ncbi:hydroxypyruvate isomerase [Methylobacterium haplocladii]|uniref:Hydroxypyruvate isomerase n=1 Tax=Methylobacterium haplocladii TaxID=1176176 RepID=A0A512IMA4_9HYPH|nr:hydroxypyruvate isomerase [Methylobacterium haplocladii]GEO98839.1 hydroxypyruvate isomerase [Methylobacterium haplocladii]GJD85144.1 Hydroxypyruvate isomerase [Methylobacterium haplocladii]GLS58783.1 hydroxypyruvate isomerase [Methylobacterium haplocladii]
MPRFAANISLLFGEHTFLDRFEQAAAAGFAAVEMQFPYDHPEEAIAERLARHGLDCVLHNLPPGDWAAGERGIAILPERVAEFRGGVARAIDYAAALGCTQVNCLAGLVPEGAYRARLHDTFVENLAFAAAELERTGIRLLIEAINTRDVPGFFLTGTTQALDLIAAVGSENLFVQYDAYHMHVMGEDPGETIAAHRDRIAHVQIADAPGRHEPGTGRIDFPELFERLDRIGYGGWIGAEYLPAAATHEGLGWYAAYRAG